MDSTDSGSSSASEINMVENGQIKMLIDEDQDSNNSEVQQLTQQQSPVTTMDNSGKGGSSISGFLSQFKLKRINRNIFPSINIQRDSFTTNGDEAIPTSSLYKSSSQTQRCHSPISSIVSTAMNQLNLKRSSSAPMINQLGISTNPPDSSRERLSLNLNLTKSNNTSQTKFEGPTPSSTCSTPTMSHSRHEVTMDLDGANLVSSFLANLNNPRPRRFSASFSPGSPGPAPNRVSQLRRQENTSEWETNSEKEFHGAQNMAQSWEDLTLTSMSVDLPVRRPSCTDPLFVSMSHANSGSASSSPAASPRVCNRFSPGLSSPSPTRKSFTSRRSMSPIATMRPSVLSVGLTNQGLKRKSILDGGSDSMDCSQPPAKRAFGLLTPGSPLLSSTPFAIHHQLAQHHQLHLTGSPNSLDTTGTESSSVSSVSGGGGDGDSPSPFFRPLDSPSDISSTGSPLTK